MSVTPAEDKLWKEIDAAIRRAEASGLKSQQVLGLMMGFTAQIIGLSYQPPTALEEALPALNGAIAREAREFQRRQYGF